ncbi:MAG: DUF2207 domain-containing protein [Clostridia bacterium]|nr:DUF2207 domain-containing protein [Clostridia bacterium]
MKKVILSFILVLMLVFSVFTVTVCAIPSDTVEKADFNAYLNADGSVNVTEKWTVSYINASNYFNRNIDVYSNENSMTLLQKYNEIKDVAVKIDGKNISEAADGINTYSFAESADGKSYEIKINCPSAQVTREYEISYTVNGALKKNRGNAVFAFVFIGDTFMSTSNNVSATVHFPDGTEKITVPEESGGAVDKNSATFSSKFVNGVFAVEVSADDNIFDNGALVSYSAAKENMVKIRNGIISVLPWIGVVIFAVAVIVLLLFSDRIRRLPPERSAKKLLKNEENVAIESLPEDISACQAYKMLVPASKITPKKTSKKVPVVFAMAVLECMEKGYIIQDDDNLIVGTPKQDVPAYIMSVLNFLKTFCEKKNNRYVISKDFAEKVNAECMVRYDIIANYLATFYSLIPETNGRFFRKNENKEKYEKAYIVKVKAADTKHKPAFAQCMSDVFDGKKTSEPAVFAMLFSHMSADKLFASDGRNGEAALCEAINAIYKVFVKSK